MIENYLIRAMNVTRLSNDSLYLLHEKEKTLGRALTGPEIQDIFHLPNCKEGWGIPDKNEDCAKHNARLRQVMGEKGLIPLGGDFDHGIQRNHDFDFKIKDSYDKMDIDFSYQGGRKSFRKQIEEEDRKSGSDRAAGE